MKDDVLRWIKEATEPLSITEALGYGAIDGPGSYGLRAEKISTLDDVMQLRVLRNECRHQMTTMRDEITEAQQLLWWQNVSNNPSEWKVWLVYRRDFPAAIGFMLLRRGLMGVGPHARWYITLGLTAAERGKGFGTWLYGAARSLSDGDPVHALILESNAASIKAAARAGYALGDWAGDPGTIKMIGSAQ